MNKQLPLYETLSPWAEADAVTPRGLTVERLANLDGKTIGLFHNMKRAAHPIFEVLERELKQRFLAARIKWYSLTAANLPEVESANKDKYEDWLKDIDTLFVAYGD